MQAVCHRAKNKTPNVSFEMPEVNRAVRTTVSIPVPHVVDRLQRGLMTLLIILRSFQDDFSAFLPVFTV